MSVILNAQINFVVPVDQVVLGVSPRNMVFPKNSYALTVTRALMDDGVPLEPHEISWAHSDSLRGPFAYLGAAMPESNIAWAVRRLVLARPAASLILKLHPWQAKREAWAGRIEWNGLVFRANPSGGRPSHALTGFSPLIGSHA